MPTAQQSRIAQDRSSPRLMSLWWAMQPLKSVVRFMQTGAHPDDEISGMLAALAFRDGLNISYACSTRGEGGQNDIGTEAGTALGALRTREMERACDVLGMRMYWHSTHAEDSVTDFGFSKSGKDTLGHWGAQRTLDRFVEIVRAEKPDIICPTFLDVPGQHGHHRAMTEMAHAVMDVAADENVRSSLPPWQVKKLYLPAWSGAGQAYDDDLPPPPATVAVPGTDREEMTGWSWDRIGQQSRAFHRTQGMGRWVPAGTGQDWLLHLSETHVAGPDDAVWSGLAHTLTDLGRQTRNVATEQQLTAAQAAIDKMFSAFPRFDEIADLAAEALGQIRAAIQSCPEEFRDDVVHRLEAKETQLARVLYHALGIEARARTDRIFIEIGSSARLEVEFDAGTAEKAEATVELPDGWDLYRDSITIGSEGTRTDPYRDFYDPLVPDAPCLAVTVEHASVASITSIAFETEPVTLPKRRVALEPLAAIVNKSADGRAIDIRVSDVSPAGSSVDLVLPEGWTSKRTELGFRLCAPIGVAEGIYEIPALIDGERAETVRLIEHDHTDPTLHAQAAAVRVSVVDVALPKAKVGYIGGGNDRVGDWLTALGADVTVLDDAQIVSEAALSEFQTIVIGIFAMRFRGGLVEAMPLLHRWTEAGGTLVTLYHRPWDNWDPDTIPPRRIEIGQPSLRWRVTDQSAAVTYLAEHPILTTPNKIVQADWDGWIKERGLYFAKSWDADYMPLLSMSDPDEEALNGSLLVADIGKGRHIHTSLILHHQMEHLVPGAFRLMANFISPKE